ATEGTRMRWLTTLLFIIALSIGFGYRSATAADGPFDMTIGVPLGTDKMTLEITLVIGGKEVTRKVEIPKGDIVAYVQPPRLQGPPKEKLADYAQRILDTQGEASHAKAKVIADAINATFKDDFAKLRA